MAGRQLAGNIASMALWQAGNYLVPLLTYPYLTRVLDIRGYGEFTFSFAIVAYATLVTDWGFSLSASGEIAQSRNDPVQITAIFWSTLAAKAALAAACLALLAVVTLVVPSLRQMWPVLASAAALVFANLFTVYWCLQGLEQLGRFALISLICRIMVVPATFLLVHGPGDVWVAAAVQGTGALTAGGASLVLVRRCKVIGQAALPVGAVLARLRSSWHLFIAAASANFYTTSNIVIIGALLGPVHAGLYTAADRLRAAAQNVVQPVSQAAYPRSSRLMASSRAEGFAFARRILVAQAGITVIVTLVLGLGAPAIIHIMAGPRYGPSINVLRVLSLAPLLIGISDTLGVQIMLPLGERKLFSQIRVRAGLVNLALVVPATLAGAETGTALGTIAAELYILAAMVLAVRRDGFRFFAGRSAAALA